ncbi:MAG: helix-turn-helix transcriptional regulator [Burkholderiaceae bacterium]
MRLIEIGHQLKALRAAKGLTQAELAELAGLTRSTVNRLENGTLNDLGTKKLLALLELLGATLTVVPKTRTREPDHVARAVSAANVSSRGRLYADELVQALLTGTAAPHKAGHVRAALEALTARNEDALIRQVGALAGQPEKVERALRRLRGTQGGPG